LVLKGISINIIKIIKSTVPYPNTCGTCMFPSFQLDRIIRCLGTPTVHHEGVRCFLCIHFQINFPTSDYKTPVFFFTQMCCNAIYRNRKYFEIPHITTPCYLHVYCKVQNTVCKRSVWA